MKLQKVTDTLEALDANLAGASFDNVKLTGATINNACLSDARISDANLSGATIEDSNLEGMSINGIRVTDLLAAYRVANIE